MLAVETKELNISEELRKRVDMTCKFVYTKSTYKNDNVAYVKPHIKIIIMKRK